MTDRHLREPLLAPPTPSSPERRNAEHLPALDGLRGIAILLVLVHHFTMHHPRLTWWDKIWAEGLAFGWMGVDLFFALSGFLITGILLQTKGATRCLRNFYARRTLRIFPLYYLTLVGLFFIWPAIVETPPAFSQFQTHQAWYWLYVANWLFATDLTNTSFHTGHFWSLAVEEQFYLVWPLIAVSVSTGSLRRVCVALFLFALAFRVGGVASGQDPSFSYVLTPARLDSLLAGAFVAILVRERNRVASFQKRAPWLIAAAAMVLAAIVAAQGDFRRGPLMLTVGFSILAVMNASLIGLAATSSYGWWKGPLESGFLRFFGKYSYAIYVFHVFIIAWMESWFPHAESFPSLGGTALIHSFAYVAAATVLSCAAALVSWRLLERPMNELKRHFPTGRAV